MEVYAIWFQMVSLSHRWSTYQDKIMAKWLIKSTMCSPVSRLGFGPSIAPFVGVSSYALEVEHVFLPVGERREWAWLMFIESLWSRLWGMEAAQLLGRVSIVRLAFALKRARKGQASSRLPGQNSPLSNYQLLSCEMWLSILLHCNDYLISKRKCCLERRSAVIKTQPMWDSKSPADNIQLFPRHSPCSVM